MSGIFKTPGKDDRLNSLAQGIAQAMFGSNAAPRNNGLLGYTDDEARKQWAWSKAKVISVSFEQLGIREDGYGARIKWVDYGNRDSGFGWEIDHSVPKDRGGSDNYNNLRPLFWRTNVEKSNKILFLWPYRWSVLHERNMQAG
jgi:HNH endonuclease